MMSSLRHTVPMQRDFIEELRVPIIALRKHYEDALRATDEAIRKTPLTPGLLVELLQDRDFFRKQQKRFEKALDGLNNVDLAND